MEDKLGKVEVALQELTRTVQRISAQNYTTKGSVYESPLKVEVCQLFFQSLMREPSDENIRLAVTRVLTVEVVRNEKFKFDDALRFCKSRLADARTDERRKCLGKHPYPRCKFMPTMDLARNIIQSMGGAIHESADVNTYCRHLAHFRSFIRHCDDYKQANHGEYRHWVQQYYSSMDEEQWDTVMQDDAAYNYALHEISVEDFERSWRRVELIATANQWNEEKKLTVIPALLRGKLLDFYAVLTSEERRDLVTMKKALSDRAGVTKDPLKSAKHFGERRQEAKESVRDFELGLRKLFKEAYPTEDADGSSAYLSRFITSLSPSIAREVLLRGTPDNIEDAVKKALDVERVMHYVKKRETEVMKVDTSEKQRHDTTQEILEQIVKRMEALESRLEKPSYRPQQASRRCYNCNEEGHYRRNCPHVERSDSSQMRKKKAQEQFNVYCPECPPGGTIGHPGGQQKKFLLFGHGRNLVAFNGTGL
ncbi:hypothetical protein EMCRGX_G020856 [Ephydatia muelleri]